MVSSEFQAMKVLYAAYPELVLEPMAWGSYREKNDVHFFVSRFHELSGDIPDVDDFLALLAKMHQRSGAKSKTGEFGFPITTYGGPQSSQVSLDQDWGGMPDQMPQGSLHRRGTGSGT